MAFSKKSRVLLFILFGILLITSYCAKIHPAEETPIGESNEPIKTQMATPLSSPTPLPTNRVKIQDSGAPLPPVVIETYPAGGEEIGEKGTIKVVFDQHMEQNSTSAAWVLVNPAGESIDGQINWPDQHTLQFIPEQPFAPGSIFKASISTKAKSNQGENLSETFRFDVHVAGELIVSQVFPEDGAQEVEANSVITVIFNRPVFSLNILEDQEDMPDPISASPTIQGYGEWLNSSVYIFHPKEALMSSMTYMIRVMDGLTDTIGSTLQEPFSWEFRTAAPTIASFGISRPVSVINPEDNYEDVRPDSSFLINFQQPMDEESVSDSFTLFTQSGENVSVYSEWTSDYQIIITPTQRLALETNYTILLTENAMSSTGGKLLEGLRWNFSTIPFPGIESTTPNNDSTQPIFTRRMSINFESPVNLDTIKDHVVINPSPGEDLSWYYNAWGWNVDFYGLNPSTNYSVTVLPGIEDIYGNPITEEYRFSFRTADLRPATYLDLPYAPSIYTMGGTMRFFVSYVNVSTVESHLYRLPIEYFVGFENGTNNRWDFTPPAEWEVNYWSWANTKNVNEITRRGIHLTDLGGDPLETGFYLLTIDSPQVFKSGKFVDTRLLIVAEANLTVKNTPTEGLIWLTDLESGEPIEDATIEILDESLNQIGTGATNSQGLLYLDLPIEKELYRSRYIKTSSDAPFAFAVSDWGSGVSPYDFGIWSSYYSLPSQPTAYVYTDRPLYRSGQTVNFKGIVRQNDDLNYSLLPWSEVEVEISSYSEVVFKGTLPLSGYGSFAGKLDLDENAALGYYSISVYTTTGEESIGGVGFTVAEYRKPEYQVSTIADPENVLAGEKYKIDIEAEYYSGGGVSNADVSWAIQAVDYNFQPTDDLNQYAFVDYDQDVGYQYEFYESASREIIADGEGRTDSEGRLSLTFTADLGESGNSRDYIFEATITDLAGTAVSDRVEIIAHKAAFYPGVRSQEYVGVIGEEQAFDLVVVDWDGKPVPGATMNVEIVERRWYSVQEQDTQGFTQWTTTVEEIPVTKIPDVKMDLNGKATVTFTPQNGGVYKAKVTVQDEFENQAKSGAYMWISSNDYVAWRQTDDRRMTLVTDKESYQPGDMAEILVASPFAGDNFALISLERGHIQQYDVIRLASNSAIYHLPITAEMAPNIYISAIVIQGNKDGNPDFRFGLVEVNVLPNQQEVNVEISADQDQSGPGERVTYQIHTTDYTGNPVQAEVSLALVDLSVLSLIGPNSSTILDYFYSGRSLGVMTTIPIVYNIEHYISTYEDRLTEGEGMGSGGGKGADVYGVFDIRGEFKDTAFWEAKMVTDENGQATVTVELPDNLTIWRMDARAITLDTKVGENDFDLRSTKPLLVRPQTPRFFVNGDQSVIGTAVHNNTDEDLSVEVTLVATGLILNSPQLQGVEIGAGEQAYISWDVLIDDDTDRVDLVVMAKGDSYSDASRPTIGTLEDQGIPVYKYEVPETIGTSGVLSEGSSRTEGIHLPDSLDLSKGDIKVDISSSLIAGMTESLNYLEHYPYECIEQTISKFLPNVLTQQALERAGISDPSLKNHLTEQINLATQRIYNWQRPDGGWGWWPESTESDPFTSAYVVFGLVEAQKAGYLINMETLDRGIHYLKGKLMSPGSFDKQYLLNRQAFLLYTLAKAGEPQVSISNVMVDHRQSLSLFAKALLAETLWMIDPADPRLDTFISDFINSAIMSATGVHWYEEWIDYWNWNSDTRTTAIILSTLLRLDPENQLNANIVRWLMSNRTEGRWRTTQETAWTLISLTRWLDITDEFSAKYDWAVGLNGERLGDGSVDGDNLTETTELRKDIKTLLIGETNRLTIARDGGPGNLYYTAHLNVSLPVDKVEPLDRGIIISRDYFKQTTIENAQPVLSAKQGDLLLARLTLVVPNDLHYVIIDDPLPAGLEAVNPSLETSPDVTAPSKYDFEGLWQEGWGWWFFDHVEYRDERVVISADYLPAGTYVYTYIVRASTPGNYSTIPPTAQEFYFPEVYGRGAGIRFLVLP